LAASAKLSDAPYTREDFIEQNRVVETELAHLKAENIAEFTVIRLDNVVCVTPVCAPHDNDQPYCFDDDHPSALDAENVKPVYKRWLLYLHGSCAACNMAG